MSPLADRLRRLRLHVGLTQADLAERLGISVSALSKIETGDRTPLIGTAEAWAHACGHSMSVEFAPLSANVQADQDLAAFHQRVVAVGLLFGSLLAGQDAVDAKVASDDSFDEASYMVAIQDLFERNMAAQREAAALSHSLRSFRAEEPDARTTYPDPERSLAMDEAERLFHRMVDAQERVMEQAEAAASSGLDEGVLDTFYVDTAEMRDVAVIATERFSQAAAHLKSPHTVDTVLLERLRTALDAARERRREAWLVLDVDQSPSARHRAQAADSLYREALDRFTRAVSSVPSPS